MTDFVHTFVFEPHFKYPRSQSKSIFESNSCTPIKLDRLAFFCPPYTFDLEVSLLALKFAPIFTETLISVRQNNAFKNRAHSQLRSRNTCHMTYSNHFKLIPYRFSQKYPIRDTGSPGGRGSGNNRRGGDHNADDDGQYFNSPIYAGLIAYEVSSGKIKEYYSHVDTKNEKEDKGSIAKQNKMHSSELNLWQRMGQEIALFFLPDGFPDSVGPSYLSYSLWRGCQNIISAITAVLSTNALLSAVGVGGGPGKRAGVAAATNWVLKDGIGQIGKLITARMGFQFDSDPKFWRLFSDILFDFGLSLEIITPLFPHYFLFMAALGNFSKSVSGTIGMSCRNSILTTFVRRENLGEISAKNDAQNVVASLSGTAIGILLAKKLPEIPTLHLTWFLGLTAIYSIFNYKAMKVVTLQTLNRQRALIVAGKFVEDGSIMTCDEANVYERIVPGLPSRYHDPHLNLGVCLGSLVENYDHNNQSKVDALTKILQKSKGKRYILSILNGQIRIAYHQDATQQDMLRSMLQYSWLRKQLVSSMGFQCRDSNFLNETKLGCKPQSTRINREIKSEKVSELISESESYANKKFLVFLDGLKKNGYHSGTCLFNVGRVRGVW